MTCLQPLGRMILDAVVHTKPASRSKIALEGLPAFSDGRCTGFAYFLQRSSSARLERLTADLHGCHSRSQERKS